MSFMKFLPQLNEFILESSWVLQINFIPVFAHIKGNLEAFLGVTQNVSSPKDRIRTRGKLFLMWGHRKKLFAALAHILLHIYERCNIRWSVLSGVIGEAHPVALNETQLVCWWCGCDAALPSGPHMKKRCCPRLQLSHLNENTIALCLSLPVCVCVFVCNDMRWCYQILTQHPRVKEQHTGDRRRDTRGGERWTQTDWIDY